MRNLLVANVGKIGQQQGNTNILAQIKQCDDYWHNDQVSDAGVGRPNDNQTGKKRAVC